MELHGIQTTGIPAPIHTRVNLACDNIGHYPHAGITSVATGPADNLGDPHGSPRHWALRGSNLFVVTVQEAGRPSFCMGAGIPVV